MGKGEPQWLDEDRSWALALLAYEDSLCDGCGLPLSQTTATENGRPAHTYAVDDPEICQGCAALHVAMPEYQGDPRVPAMKFRLVEIT